MKYDLTIKNFQSIKHAELEIFGLTVLWGAHSSIGKSAVVRALDAMLFGSAPKGIVRTGEKAAFVMLEWEDHVIKWAKGDNINGYVIDGTKFDKVGRSVPEEISDLGFYSLEMQDMTVKPQVRKQFDKAWPLILSAPDLGKVVGSLVRTEKVYAAIKSLLADGGKIRTKRGKVETLLAEKSKELRSFDGLDRVKEAIGRISYTDAKEVKARLQKAEEVVEAQRLAQERIDSYREPTPLPDPAAIVKLLKTTGLIDEAARFEAQVLASTISTPEPPDPAEISKLLKITEILDTVAQLEFKITSCAVVSSELPDPAHIELLTGVERCIKSMEVKTLLYEQAVQSLDEFTTELEKQGVVVCDTCDGTGLAPITTQTA